MTKDFLRPYEKICIQLFEKLDQKDDDIHLVIRTIEDDILICGLFYFSKGGTVLPFFLEKDFDVEMILKDFFSTHFVFCVSGEKSSVDFISSCIMAAKKQIMKEKRNFFLMESSSNPFEKSANPKICENLFFRQCTKDDSDFLFPLQIAYIKEEVVPDGIEVNLSAERFTMDKLLKNGKIYAVTDSSKKILCKVQINGGTDLYELIGGVFTDSNYRKKGIATFMMKELKQTLDKKNKKCILYVNVKNNAALSLYEKSGFKICGDYEIAYWKM